MVEYAKRSEVTIETMGKVHNPTGEGVRAMSAQVQAKAAKVAAAQNQAGATATAATTTANDASTASSSTAGTGASGGSYSHSLPSVVAGGGGSSHHGGSDNAPSSHETKVKEGTAKRNITRKKTSGSDSGNYNSCHKKQGGHGKGHWKDVADPSHYTPDDRPVDEKDPLYDEVEHGKYILSSHPGTSSAPGGAPNGSGAALDPAAAASSAPRGYDPATSKAVYGPMLTECEFKHQVGVALQEYFDSDDPDEFIRSLLELRCREYSASVVKKAVSLALDKGPREREAVSRLLTVLHPTPLADEDMGRGFAALLDSLDDLQTDVPEANQMIACFLARAVVDEVLPPAFLSNENNNRPGCLVIEKAIGLLNREHSTARLERIWGPGDGRSVDELKAEMKHLLQEYLLSRELDEAARCVRELECSYFHHELVKRGAVTAMELEGSAEENLDAMAALFGFLVGNAIVSEHQVQKGLSRLRASLPDVALDVPAAPRLLDLFEDMLAHSLSKAKEQLDVDR